MQSERVQNDLGATAGLRYRNGRPRTSVTERYLAAENRILKAQIKGRLLLSEEEKATLAEIAHRLPRKSLRLRLARLRIWWFDPIAEASELANHSRGALLL